MVFVYAPSAGVYVSVRATGRNARFIKGKAFVGCLCNHGAFPKEASFKLIMQKIMHKITQKSCKLGPVCIHLLRQRWEFQNSKVYS